MDIVKELTDRAKNNRRRVVLPEAQDQRVLTAAIKLAADGIATPILVGDRERLATSINSNGASIDDFTLEDPECSEHLPLYADLYRQARPKASREVALRLLRKPLFFAALMVRALNADVLIAGATNPTARVIEAGLMGIGTKDGIKVPSSFFLMVVPTIKGEPARHLVFADCALNVDPDPGTLADIAIASATSAERLLSQPARVAMLSFSSKGSAKHPQVDKVSEAVDIARSRAPSLAIDGELQVDSALDPRVANLKLAEPGHVAGNANVLIFPDLNAGNIGYKLTQYLAGAQAIGPILQGFNRPVSDLSRGASVDDIVASTAIALALAD